MTTSVQEYSVTKEIVPVPWWLFLGTGIIWLAFALLVLSFNFTTIWAVAVWAGCLFLAVGISEFLAAGASKNWRWFHFLMGLVGITAGITAFVWPGETFLTLAGLVAWFLMFLGVFNVIGALMTKSQNEFWYLPLIAGIAQILIAFWAVGYAGRSIVLLVIWVGAAALAKGITDIALAFRVKHATS